MEKKDLKIVFFGTPEFAVESLKNLYEKGYNISAVVTMPDRTGGRGNKVIESDVKKYALSVGLPILQPDKLKAPEFVDKLREINADLFIVIAFRMLPEVVWQMPRLGTFNLHGSLLPKYRGAAPINRAIMAGETETGVTTFFLKHEIDTGDIIDSRSTPIGPDDDFENVYNSLMKIGADMVIDTVDSIIKGSLNTIPQPEGDFSPAPKIFKEDCKIDWSKSAQEIHNLVRGLCPIPTAFTNMVDNDGKITAIKIFKTKISEESIFENETAPGQILISNKKIYVATGDGTLEIISLQPAGKKRMDSLPFILGYHPAKFVD